MSDQENKPPQPKSDGEAQNQAAPEPLDEKTGTAVGSETVVLSSVEPQAEVPNESPPEAAAETAVAVQPDAKAPAAAIAGDSEKPAPEEPVQESQQKPVTESTEANIEKPSMPNDQPQGDADSPTEPVKQPLPASATSVPSPPETDQPPQSQADIPTDPVKQPLPDADADADTAPQPPARRSGLEWQSDTSGRQTLYVRTPGKPADAAPAPALQKCPKCGHTNRMGVLACERCGTLLVSDDEGRVRTKRFGSDEEAAPEQPAPSTVSETMRQAVSSAGSAEFHDNMILRLEIEGSPTPVLLTPTAETVIGRRDPATGTMPDIDMTTYAGYRLGVSRKHAIIRLKNKQLELYDLGSSNGTALNGVRMVAHQPYVLRDGDEITLGKMTVRVLFQSRNRSR